MRLALKRLINKKARRRRNRNLNSHNVIVAYNMFDTKNGKRTQAVEEETKYNVKKRND